jgi:CRP-like cAMP-binding protein
VNPDLHLAAELRHNPLLAALCDADGLRPGPERVELRSGQVLCEPGVTPTHVYFPTTAVVSLLYLTRDGESAEVAVVGNEGVVGVGLIMGGNATPSQAIVHGAGVAYRVRAHDFKAELGRGGAVLAALLRYTQALMAQVAQTAACNRHHSIEQQFCRRLLAGLDRSATDELAMTQELVASLLGVRREGVTAAALKLQRSGVIRYARGQIAVLDRARLEHHSCECYAAAKKETARLLGTPVPLPMRRHPPVPLVTPIRLPQRLPARGPQRTPVPLAG